ncbi:hypothetical protein MRB53_032125 [Persea americana]|uniref:Uncharacterized protein n=1 Tax=Persea americana TaxID=3435 RepID=A0ACC2KR36_PERAE|nr:hypothetical protein MRB53_032125 [Persea americana]
MIGNPNGQVGGEEGASGASSGCAMKECRWVHRCDARGASGQWLGVRWVAACRKGDGEKDDGRRDGWRWNSRDNGEIRKKKVNVSGNGCGRPGVPARQPTSGMGFAAPSQSSPFGTRSTFGRTAANPFSSTMPFNPFGLKTPTFGPSGFATPTTLAFSSPFGTSSSAFGRTTSASAPIFGPSPTPPFGAGSSSSLFSASTTPSFGSSPSIFGSSELGTTATFSNTQSSGQFQSSTPSLGQTTSVFGQTTPAFGQTTSAFGQTNPFGTQSSGFVGNLFTSNSTPSLLFTSNPGSFSQTTPSISSPSQAVTPAQTSGAFSFSNFGLTQPPASSGLGGISNVFGQGTFCAICCQSEQHGHATSTAHKPFWDTSSNASDVDWLYWFCTIYSIWNFKHPYNCRLSGGLGCRQGNIILKRTVQSDEEESPSTPKADSFFIPKENPRALIIRPMEQWSPRTSAEKQSLLKDMPSPVHGNESVAEEGFDKHRNASPA